LFLAGIWAATKAMLDASAFVNQLRDTVVIGHKEGQPLTLRHREVLRIDWLLTMVGAVLFPSMYSAFLFVIVFGGITDGTAPYRAVLGGVACIPIIGSLLFFVCGIGDWRLMQEALATARQHAQESRLTSNRG